ncbi:caspase family protein [Synechococcus sp. BDU 130192]|uniref:caspase family protein n=1 Tax=Synechococcus sp. BDU 130192 TaxID=2042059 RepID=UPI000C06D796|nr:caspase family protein [Synechococcus sp. BDU 130192]
MAWRRRDFLQALGLTCGALGFSSFLRPSDLKQSAQALSQFRGRKIALLIGIDQYGQGPNLGGCQQDLKIQKHLLESRFGFAATDIVTLRNDQASGSGIFTTFQTDLKTKVKPEDLVFVHFSGYGTRLVTDPTDPEPIPALVLPGKSGPEAIALSTFQALIQDLNPAQGILVLDTSFDPGSRPPAPYWRPRTYPDETAIAPIVAPETTTVKSNSSFALGRSALIQLWAATEGVTPEVQINGVMTGLFTAALGQYLSAYDPMVTVTTAQTNLAVRLPKDETQPATMTFLGTKTAPLYGTLPSDTLPATGQIFSQNPTGLEVYLGGFEPEILQAIAPGSELTIRTETAPILQLSGKAGVFGQGKSSTQNVTVGTAIQETKRHLPRNLALKIALAEDLSRIERVDATSAFASLTNIASVSNPQDWVDYVFDEAYQLTTVPGKIVPGVVPASDTNEAIKSSVNRLLPRLEQLLALKWLRLLVNETSTQLPLKVTVQRLDRFSTLLTAKTTPFSLGQSKSNPNPQPTFTVGEKGQYQLENTGTQPLFCLGFAQSPKQELLLLTAKEGLKIPPETATSPLELTALRPLGVWTIYWIIGDRPFENFQDQATQLFGDLETIPQKLEKSLPLIQGLLSDLQVVPPEGTEPNKENYVFSTTQWAGLCFTYTVVETEASS